MLFCQGLKLLNITPPQRITYRRRTVNKTLVGLGRQNHRRQLKQSRFRGTRLFGKVKAVLRRNKT